MSITNEVFDEKKQEWVTVNEEVSVAPFPEHGIDVMLGAVVDSEWVQQECEDANYHSALDFLREIIPIAQKEMTLKRVGWPNG